MNRAAQFVVLTGRDVFCLAKAIPKVDAVGRLARCAIVARADYLIVFNDYGAEPASEACAPHCHGISDIYVILTLRRPFHFSLVEIMCLDINRVTYLDHHRPKIQSENYEIAGATALNEKDSGGLRETEKHRTGLT
jgi:hypothetical protein